MPRTRSDRLSAALQSLEKIYGRVPVLPEGKPIDQLVALFFFKDGHGERAAAAVGNLLKEFVDFNEVRISWNREVAAPLAAAGYRDAARRAEDLRAFLDVMYRERNAVNLGSLATLEPEEAFAWLKALDAVDDGTAAATVSLFLDEGSVLAVPEILRIATRFGVAGKDATSAKVRKALEARVRSVAERVRAHYLFARHSEEICRVRSPRCVECGANDTCAHGIAAVRSGAGGKAKASKERPARKSADRAPAPRKRSASRPSKKVKEPSPKASKSAKGGKAAGKKRKVEKAPPKGTPAGKKGAPKKKSKAASSSRAKKPAASSKPTSAKKKTSSSRHSPVKKKAAPLRSKAPKKKVASSGASAGRKESSAAGSARKRKAGAVAKSPAKKDGRSRAKKRSSRGG